MFHGKNVVNINNEKNFFDDKLISSKLDEYRTKYDLNKFMKEIKKQKEEDRKKKMINMPPPEDMTVRENIAFGLKMRNIDKKTIEKKVKEASEILDLEEYLDRKPRELSGGQRQRVALGRAIVRNPKVFLMDEPLSNLDAKLRVQMRSEIKKLHEKLKTTFIYVTHDQTEALTMGDRVVVLDGGIIQQADTPEEIYNNPANTFVAGFVGSPQMNFIDNKDFPYNKIENAIIGIRPEKMVCGGKIKFTVKVDMVELLGSEKIVYFNIGDKKCSAKLPANYKIEDNLELSINPADIYLFNKQTGCRI